MDYKEEIVQIMPAPNDLYLWLYAGDETKIKCRPLCLALIKKKSRDKYGIEYESENIEYVVPESDGLMEFVSDTDSNLIGVLFESENLEVKPMTDDEKRSYRFARKCEMERIKNGGDPK